ncbi:MAG: hypothetical protein V1723_03420 [Candidatus Uhrbacteria bacterium]
MTTTAPETPDSAATKTERFVIIDGPTSNEIGSSHRESRRRLPLTFRVRDARGNIHLISVHAITSLTRLNGRDGRTITWRGEMRSEDGKKPTAVSVVYTPDRAPDRAMANSVETDLGVIETIAESSPAATGPRGSAQPA